MNKRLIIPAFCLGLMLLLGDLSLVFAQESGSEEFTLEEITVTAQKREENQQKVPITMEVISGETMKELGYDNVDEILASVGNAVINKAGDGYRVALRGVTDDFGVFNGLTTSTPTVAISTDDVYSTRNDRGMGLYDIERMEVLYGPQSTMYANTSPGGIIRVITAAPKTDKYEVSGAVEYGNYNYLRTEGSMNAPISNKVAIRAAFSTSVRDGYISNGADDEDIKSARLKTLFQATEKLSFVLTGEYNLQGGHGFASVNEFIDQDDEDDPWTSDSELGAPNNRKQNGLNANVTWETGIGTLTVLPSFSKTTSSQVGEDFMSGDIRHTDFKQTEKSAEMRMTSSSDFFIKWIAGLNYFKSDNNRSGTTEGSIAREYSGYWDETKAIYANITYPVTDAFRITAGGRKNWAKMTTHNETLNSSTSQMFGPPQPNLKVTQNPDGTYDLISDNIQEYPNTDYKFGVEYDLGANSMVYADVSTSYRFQGQTMPDADGNYPPPEEMIAYTLGAKNRFMGNKLQVNVSAYWYDYKNKFASGNPTWFIYMWEDDPRLIEYYGEPTDINNNGHIDIATDYQGRGQPSLADPVRAKWGDYRSRGLDIQTSWMISSKDRADFSYSYGDNVWTDLYYHYVYSWIYPDVDLSGVTNVNSPKHTIVLTYNHNFPLRNGGTLTTRFDTRYQTEYIISFKKADSPWRDQEAYHISGLSLIYAHSDGKWTLTGSVKNLENYAVKRSLFGKGEDPENQKMIYDMMIGSPRTYSAVLSVRF